MSVEFRSRSPIMDIRNFSFGQWHLVIYLSTDPNSRIMSMIYLMIVWTDEPRERRAEKRRRSRSRSVDKQRWVILSPPLFLNWPDDPNEFLLFWFLVDPLRTIIWAGMSDWIVSSSCSFWQKSSLKVAITETWPFQVSVPFEVEVAVPFEVPFAWPTPSSFKIAGSSPHF